MKHRKVNWNYEEVNWKHREVNWNHEEVNWNHLAAESGEAKSTDFAVK